MRFGVPPQILVVWLIAVPTAVAALLVALAVRRNRAVRRAFAEEALLARVAPEASTRRLRFKGILLVLAVLALGVAAGRPQVGTKLGVAKRGGVDLMIAVDVSASMEARDFAPNRLEKAKREALALIDKLDGDRVGIIIFAGTAFVQCPLTLDYGAASMLLSAAEPGVMPVPGTAIGDAIRAAVAGLSTEPNRSKVLVLMTDGEDHGSDPEAAAQQAHDAGLTIFTIGFGSTAGEPIPVPAGEGGGYKRDEAGQIVMSRLDEGTLIDVASETGGRYFRATAGERELSAIDDEISDMKQGELESRMYAYYEERFQFPLAFALALLALEALIPDRVRRSRERTI
jgi:Ca-activated chloride channel family protein